MGRLFEENQHLQMEGENTSEAADNGRSSADTTSNPLLASTVPSAKFNDTYSKKIVEAKAEFDAKDRKLMEAMAKLERIDSEDSVDEKKDLINEVQIYKEIYNCNEEYTKALLKYVDLRMEPYNIYEGLIEDLMEVTSS